MLSTISGHPAMSGFPTSDASPDLGRSSSDSAPGRYTVWRNFVLPRCEGMDGVMRCSVSRFKCRRCSIWADGSTYSLQSLTRLSSHTSGWNSHTSSLFCYVILRITNAALVAGHRTARSKRMGSDGALLLRSLPCTYQYLQLRLVLLETNISRNVGMPHGIRTAIYPFLLSTNIPFPTYIHSWLAPNQDPHSFIPSANGHSSLMPCNRSSC